MNPRIIQLYHRLPPWSQSAIATVRGWQLRQWRYPAQSESLVREALARETWSAEQWQVWREARLRKILQRAMERVPHYRDYWQRRGSTAGWERLENWPILEKEQLRANPMAFVADDCDIRRMFPEHTSGSTGRPLHLWWSRETTSSWYALFEARWKRWYGVSRHDRWGMLGGQLVVPTTRTKPPYWVWNASLHQLYLSSFHLTSETIPHYLDAIERFNLRYLWGYPSALFELAARANELGRTIPLSVVIANAEPLQDYQREVIAKAFACPVRETYGMAEIVSGASECPAGRLHLWPEAGIVEILEGDDPVRSGDTGDLVGTGLVNPDMPLIRYRLGDRAAIEPEGTPCPCGRTLPLLRGIEGRLDDVVVTPSGRRVGRLDVVFKADLPIRGAQVVQEEVGKLVVRFVPASSYTAADGERLVARFHDYLGPMQIELQPVAEVPRDRNGKVRGVISTITRASRSAEVVATEVDA